MKIYGVIVIKSKIFSLTLLSVVILSSCSTQETSDYHFNQKEALPVTQQEFLIDVIKQEDQEPSNSGPTYNNSPTEYASEQTNKQERVLVKVLEVIDSDTVKVEHPELGLITLRFLGINGPEYTKEKQMYGKESTEFLTELISGKEIGIELDPNADSIDRYGRYLVHAFIGGKSIQSILLMEGLVKVAYLYGEYKYIDIYKEAENQAKSAALNIWSIPGYVDSKNGFNMDVITENIEVNLIDKISGFLSERIK